MRRTDEGTVSRAQRLLELIQILRRHRRPVSGAHLAEELGISLRTLYRDIATLAAQGAHIEGEAGVGYVLRPGFVLPPLMFSEEEIEAVVLGSRWVAESGDGSLSEAARNALAKIVHVLPAGMTDHVLGSGLMVAPTQRIAADAEPKIREAIRKEHKLRIHYVDREGETSARTVWPFVLGYFEKSRVVAAWCETRQGYRHFRTDRIVAVKLTSERYPRRRHALVKEWRAIEGIPTADKI
jgi:predicted DNA-binding transcriptional regulator YafY